MDDHACRRSDAGPKPGGRLRRGFQAGLESLRREMGLSKQDFARRLGLARSSYFHLMSGSANPSLGSIERIAAHAGVDPWRLLREPPRNEASVAANAAHPPGCPVSARSM